MKRKTRTAPNPKPSVSMAGIMAQLNKKLGKGTMIWGTQAEPDFQRLPFGVFAADFVTGGGLPMWQSSALWGSESAGKSFLAIKAMRSVALLCWRCFNPKSFCTCSTAPLSMGTSWADVEGSLDKGWIEQCGVPPDSFEISRCESGEQFVDTAEAILTAHNCGLLVVDSIAALMPEAEQEASASQQFMGNQAKLITKGVKKLKARLLAEMRKDHPCTVLFINQMRKKLGMVFGSPEEMPGGHAYRHDVTLVLRCVKKSLGKRKEEKEGVDSGEANVDKYLDGDRKKEQASRHAFSVHKERLFTLAGSGEFIIVKEDMPSLRLKKGMVDDFPVLFKYALEYGVITKEGKDTYKFFNYKATSPEKIKTLWKMRPEEYLRADMAVVKKAKERVTGKEEVR